LKSLPVGKLPVDLLNDLLNQSSSKQDPRVILGPGIGIDCAVIENGPTFLVYKTDPITFATDQIGWYLVQVNANDIATTGALPRWLLVTALLPGQGTTDEMVKEISAQIQNACQSIGVSVIGGHTEITYGLERPILVGTMIGEVDRRALVTPRGAVPGNRILLTKGIPIEATAILAREFPERLSQVLSSEELGHARNYLFDPGISILRDAQLAMQAGAVTAMHDPTEGGLATALWELAEASNRSFYVDLSAAPISPISERICQAFDLDPFASIASGALLLTCQAQDAQKICSALNEEGISCAEIGEVGQGPASVWSRSESGLTQLPRPERDDIAGLFFK
jgi:hydrogenase expression/formation protein HypE